MKTSSPREEKSVVCSSCDIHCLLTAEVVEGQVVKVRALEGNPVYHGNICMKGIYAPKGFASPKRIQYPLKRIGERGSGQWERVTWDEALDDIAKRLQAVVAEHGPEAFGVSTSQWNTSVDHGLGRRLMNLMGSPNWISGVALCAGNTAAINRMVYGWYPLPDFFTTQCIVLFGHNPRRHSWTPIYNMIRGRQAQGAKLIVLDPRKSESAERADIWLPLRAGTDAAMMLGWCKVIFDEELYDKKFVEKWCVGVDEFRQRLEEYPLERVAEITGCDAQQIAAAARLYATTPAACIPWTPITDQQANSTSAIRLQCTLRAITGNLDAPGGDVLHGYNVDVIPESDIEIHGVLSDAQKAKQLGSDTHPAFTYRGQAKLKEPTKKVWGREYANLVTGCYMANPTAFFRAMEEGDPYPIKAFFILGNNPLMSYANMQRIYAGMMNQDLIVAVEHVMTPSAQLADYVLPGDSWLERPNLCETYGWTRWSMPSEKAMEPPGECKSVFWFWCEMAKRLGYEEHFPWDSQEAFYDWRLEATGKTFAEFCKSYTMRYPILDYRKYEKTGFATPSGKVELYSSVLDELGFDPLPYYREIDIEQEEFPLQMFMGLRDNEYFQTGHRHIPELRKRRPEPEFFLNAKTAAIANVEHGAWAKITTKDGSVQAQVHIREDMPNGLVRVPHGWWKPEMEQGLGKLSGAWAMADAQITPDDEHYLDREQGIPHLKGIPCRLEVIATPEHAGGDIK
tara:strand:+ start:1868 stop:4078 length:2211 start_codon:yes stop_codon:yes gene_type:complete